MNNWQVLATFLIVRLASIFLVKTWYVPDEYWQSLEVAHKFAFGYGELTWEWQQGIRSYIHPLIIAFVYKILQLTGLDYVQALIFIPRLMQASLSSYADYRFYKWSGTKKWAIFIILTSYFWFYTGSRTLINSFETALTTIALSYFPWPDSENIKPEKVNKFIWILGLLCVVRPTAAIPWLPLCIYHWKTSNESIIRLLVNRYVPIGFTILVCGVVIDSYAHGSILVSWYQFLKANILQGVGTIYGANPWYWYLSQGLPVLLGVNFIPFILATYHFLRNRDISKNELALLASIVFTVSIYSTLSHKEHRFLLPLLPMALHITAKFLAQWSWKADMILIWIASGVLLVGNIIPTYYLSFVHQRGTLDVMYDLQDIVNDNPQNKSILILMPCHSTPLYSHLHVNVPVRYLTCLPNFGNVENYKDEAETFFENPGIWIRTHYPGHRPLPSHIVAFDVLQAFITDILKTYRPIKEIFHTNIISDRRIGRHIIIYELIQIRASQEKPTNS